MTLSREEIAVRVNEALLAYVEAHGHSPGCDVSMFVGAEKCNCGYTELAYALRAILLTPTPAPCPPPVAGSETGIPRRIDISRQTPIEAAIRAARDAVEAGPAHPHMTRATVLLGQALDAVADFVDGVPEESPHPNRLLSSARALSEKMALAALYTDSGDAKYDNGWGVDEALDALRESIAATSSSLGAERQGESKVDTDNVDPGTPICEASCPCCGAELKIMHGEEEGEISVEGFPAAHPAATAREEAWKAMVEACERIYDSASRLSRSARPCRDGHRVDSGVLGEVESDIDDLRAALALARSVKGTEA